MLSFPGFEDFVTQKELDVFDNGRYEEIVQMLSDLGYLTISAEEGEIVNPTRLKKAVFSFRREAISGSLISKSAMQLPFPEIPQEDHEGILTYREFNVLQLLVSLDGDFNLKPISEIRNIGIYTRVLQYRLHLLGLLENQPDGYFTDLVKSGLDQLASWLAPLEIGELLNLTGNFGNLIIRLRESKAFANRLVYFKFHLESSHAYHINGPNDSFFDQLKKDIGKNSPEFKGLKLKSHPQKFDKQFFEAQCNDPDAKMVIRLLQLSQWISGYYLGIIDGELGKFTFSSFLQLAQNEAENGNPDFKMNLFVGYISDDYWVVNPHYMFKQMILTSPDNVPMVSDVFNIFDQEYQKLDADGKEIVNENMQFAWKNINVEFSNDLKSSANRFRRIYYGARSMLQSFWKGMKNIFKFLKEKTVEKASGLFNLVKNFAKFLYREIREALQIFSRGLKFLVGKRELITKDCFTKFDFDMDCINYNPLLLTDSLLKEYQQLHISTTTGLTFCLTLTGRIIRLAIIASLGWHRLIIEAGIMLKELVKECYSEKEYNGYTIDPQG